MPGKYDLWFNYKQIIYGGGNLNAIILCKAVFMNLRSLGLFLKITWRSQPRY